MGFYSHTGLWLRRFQVSLYHLLDFANNIPSFLKCFIKLLTAVVAFISKPISKS